MLKPKFNSNNCLYKFEFDIYGAMFSCDLKEGSGDTFRLCIPCNDMGNTFIYK